MFTRVEIYTVLDSVCVRLLTHDGTGAGAPFEPRVDLAATVPVERANLTTLDLVDIGLVEALSLLHMHTRMR